MATKIIAPLAKQQAVNNATGTITDLLTQQAAMAVQLRTDMATVATGWANVAPDEQTAILLRMLGGFGVIMEAIVAHLVVNGLVTPPIPPQPTPSDATPSDATPSDATPSDATPSDATPSDATPVS